jgi:hypothetical protein
VLATAAWSAVDSHRMLETAQAARDRVATLRPAPAPRPAVRSAAPSRPRTARPSRRARCWPCPGSRC